MSQRSLSRVCGMLVRSALLAWLALVAPASAQPEEDSLARMLRAVPAPADLQSLMRATPLLAYIRLDLLAGVRGPTVDPGTTRLLKWGPALMPGLAVSGMLNSRYDLWPATVGFDLDAVDAVLTAPMADNRMPGSTLRVLAGAPRLHDAARIGEALQRRGFTHDEFGTADVFSFGDGPDIGFRNRTPGDPFVTLFNAQRIAVTPAGLLAASETGLMHRSLDALAGRASSLADIDGMRGVLAGLEDTEVVQAIVLSPLAGLGIALQPPPSFAQPNFPPGPGGPPLPTWGLAALAQLAAPPDQPLHRIVLVLPDPGAARAALQARIEAAKTGGRPLPIASVETRVLPERFGAVGVLVADIHMAPGTNRLDLPLSRWWSDIKLGISTPITFGTREPSLPDGGPRR